MEGYREYQTRKPDFTEEYNQSFGHYLVHRDLVFSLYRHDITSFEFHIGTLPHLPLNRKYIWSADKDEDNPRGIGVVRKSILDLVIEFAYDDMSLPIYKDQFLPCVLDYLSSHYVAPDVLHPALEMEIYKKNNEPWKATALLLMLQDLPELTEEDKLDLEEKINNTPRIKEKIGI